MRKYRITESRLRNMIRESVRMAIMEGLANEYKGVFIPEGFDTPVYRRKIDALLEKGWRPEEIERALEEFAGDVC